jgi:hypothetical protein
MEVHAHTHTERKKWTHYFWEFLMLFLAVFCGFMAENQREHMVENQREKKYMQSLASDLAADTLRLSNILQQRISRTKMLDSFAVLINRPDAASIVVISIIIIPCYPRMVISLYFCRRDHATIKKCR